MELIEATELAAFTAVVKPDSDPEYFWRFIFRWFSKEFNTPLLQVYDLPMEFVLQHYFENYFEHLDEHEREKKRKEFLLSAADRKKALKEKEKKDFEDERFAERESKREQEKNLQAKQKVDQKQIPTQKIGPTKSFSKQASLPSAQLIPKDPEVKIEFISEEDLELLSEELKQS